MKKPRRASGGRSEYTAILTGQHAFRGVAYPFQRKPKTQSARANRAFKNPDAHGSRLVAALGDYAYWFRLDVSDLDAVISDHPDGLDHHAPVNALFKAAACLFQGPFYMVLEAGGGDYRTPDQGRLHAHIAAHRNDGPGHITRESQRCKWLHNPRGAYRYTQKHRPPTLEAQLSYAAALVVSPTGRTPKVRRPFLSPSRMAYAAELTARAEPLPQVLECGKCRGRCLCRRGPHFTNGQSRDREPPRAAAGNVTAEATQQPQATLNHLRPFWANRLPLTVAGPPQRAAQRVYEARATQHQHRKGGTGSSEHTT